MILERSMLTLLILLVAWAPVQADDDEDEREGLVVDRVLVKGPGAEGIEIEVRYWLVDVDDLPGHPSKTTLIMDEETNQGVMLRRLQAIAGSVSEEQMEATPPATLTFWDDRGVIRPGHAVSIAVAGLVAQHVVPEAGEGYVEGAFEEALKHLDDEAREVLPEGASLEVIEARLGGEGGLLQVRFRTRGVPAITADGKYTYVIDPETGERFDILRVPRLGLMAPKHLGEYAAGSYMVIRTPEGKIKPGQKITVVVEGLRQEDVVVE